MTGYGSSFKKPAALLVSGLLFGLWAGQAAAQVVADDVQCSGCVGKGDIADKAVTARKIKSNSIFSPKIINRSIQGIDIDLGAVGEDELADGAVTDDKLGTDVQDRLSALETAAGAYPASVVAEFANSASASVTDIRFGDTRTVIGTCAPGGTVELDFDWSFVRVASNIQQINVGFVGGDTRCVASGVIAQTGSSALDLTCPSTPGPHQLGVRRTFCFGCPPDCSNTGNHAPPSDTTPGFSVGAAGPSFVGVVTVK